MDEQERFNQICKPCLDELKKGNAEILALLKGVDKEPGLLDDVRQLQGRWKHIFAAIGMLFAALAVQVIAWVVSKFQ